MEQNMDQVIRRINELASKARAEGLNEEELAERDKLRNIYRQKVLDNLRSQLGDKP